MIANFKVHGLAFLALAAFGASLPAFGGISYTCAADIDGTQAGTCAYLNTTIAGLYSGVFAPSSIANVNILIQMGTTGLGESTSGNFNLVSYGTYAAALAAEGGPGTVRADALTSLSSIASTSYGTSDVDLTSALASALGITTVDQGGVSGPGSAVAGIDLFNNPCANPGVASGCYNGIITITTPANLSSETGGTQFLYWDQTGGSQPSNAYDFYSVVQHETDEVLGTASCMDTQGTNLADDCDFAGGTGTPSAVDLYRYNALGSLSLNSACIGLNPCPGSPYFSYDGGLTNGNPNGNLYNPASNGDDYSDFVAYGCGTPPYNVQDGRGCTGTHPWINSDGGAEINILDAVGFNVQLTTPEPGTLGLFSASLATLVFLRRRYSRK